MRAGGHDDLVPLLLGQGVIGEDPALVLGPLRGGFGTAARFTPGGSPDASDLIRLMGISGTATLISVVVNILYGAITESQMGGTPGKMALGLRVGDAAGNNLSFGAALIRNLVKFFTAGCTCYLALLVGFFTANKQALHDMAASTFVLEK